ncbi:protein kinase domain-containing protein [Archangium sp.]|uniref:serine/threonine protein kinase n=1 Tax=Archangium sp. TaxID=1872627 RepID=UPI00286BE17F|nr:protein kinase [Archangium sp.]
MQQEETAGRAEKEKQRQAVARWQRRRLLRWLGREGAQEEFLPKVGEVVGGFTLEARLGAGSYGTVYRARRGDELYALKLLYLPHAGAWPFRELEVLLRLHYARLVGVEAHGHHCLHPEVGPLFLYIVMDYVPGLPLDEYVERHNPAASWAARAVLALAAQLAVAHAVGVVHRDLKDDNVVVGEEGQAVLVDFGVGTFPGALEVSRWRLPNVPPFRAPEAWRFQREAPRGERYEASARDDLWALGVLLYGLLTGTRPFHGESDEEVAQAVLHARPVPPHERNPRVPQVLSDVCLRMLEKEPGERYPDAKAVGAALEAALAGADARWEVPLCEAWGPDNATTRHEDGWVDLEWAGVRHRRVSAYERERPRRGKPAPAQVEALVPPLGEESPAGEEVVAPPEETAAQVPPAPGGAPVEEVAPEPVAASEPPPARVASGCARAWRDARWALAVGVLLAVAHPYSVPAPGPVDASPPPSLVASFLPMPEVKPWSGQEVAPPWCPLEGDGGAVPSWTTTLAPVARATLLEDMPVKTPRQDSGPEQRPLQKQRQGRSAVAKVLCTATAGAVAAGCPGAQVRDTPKPEACPLGSVEVMKRLGIRTGEETGSEFPEVAETEQYYVTVREGPGARLVLGRPLGQLEAGTVVTGRFLFGEERVYGRFTQARTPGGDTYSVCLEAWGIWQYALVRGLPREPHEGGPGTATVNSVQHVKAVERFE